MNTTDFTNEQDDEPPRRTNAGLTAKLLADQAALANDLAQAQEIASDFRRVASDKTNEVAHLKGLLEQLKNDFGRYEKHTAELRAERHDLANEVMKLTALHMQAGKTADKLRTENAALREQLAGQAGGGNDQRVDELARMVERLQLTIDGKRGEVAPLDNRRERASRDEFIDIAFGT